MLTGLMWSAAGVLYVGVGWLQEAVELTPTMLLSYACLLPAGLEAIYILKGANCLLLT